MSSTECKPIVAADNKVVDGLNAQVQNMYTAMRDMEQTMGSLINKLHSMGAMTASEMLRHDARMQNIATSLSLAASFKD
jgi:uncharacterized coiled-coil protein SlyX